MGVRVFRFPLSVFRRHLLYPQYKCIVSFPIILTFLLWLRHANMNGLQKGREPSANVFIAGCKFRKKSNVPKFYWKIFCEINNAFGSTDVSSSRLGVKELAHLSSLIRALTGVELVSPLPKTTTHHRNADMWNNKQPSFYHMLTSPSIEKSVDKCYNSILEIRKTWRV